jgi:diadenylate cyclase
MNFLLDTSAQTSVKIDDIWGLMKNAFSEFTFFDVVDILFLSVIFFFVFKFFRGKKGGALLIGIALCVAVWFVSVALGLDGTSLIFSKLFEIGAVALVVIFQPEIRDILEKIGSGSISGIMNFGEQKKKQQIYYKAVDNVCIAVGDLARTKTGALIVLSRTTNLDDVIATGITINADVNPFLLRNLFFNKAPLHDGAVVIDDARVVSAACLLPLTRRQDIDGDLGTRHRAAIGMSEISDAIIIVVSEETGTISVASDCMLERNYTPDTLRSFLLKAWVREKSDGIN